MENNFYWEMDSKDYITIGYKNGRSFPENMVCTVSPAYGSNLCKMTVNGYAVIDFDEKMLHKHDYTGTPVLYPAPNRVRNAMFAYDGKIYHQNKGGNPVFEHGLVHDEAWQYSTPKVTKNDIRFDTWIRFHEENVLFEAFPFRHTLRLAFIMRYGEVSIQYSIENEGKSDLPFGFGLHPYFMKLCGEDGTLVSLPAKYVMDATSDLLPTGKLADVEHTIYDLKKPVPIGDLDMDHVFTGIEDGKTAQVIFSQLRFKVKLQSTPDFSHLVLYSPRGQNFFCLESQTCSTDAHNLFDRGFKTESGLKIVKPETVYSGSVTYKIEVLN